MNFKFLFFIFYNSVSQTESIENQNNYVNEKSLSEKNYGHAEIKCGIYSCDSNNNYQLFECAAYSAIVHLPTKAICFIDRTKNTKDAMPFPLYQYDFQTDNSNNKPLNSGQNFIYHIVQPLDSNSDHQGQNYNQFGSDMSNTHPESYNIASPKPPNRLKPFKDDPICYLERSSLKKLCFEYSFNLYRPDPYIFFDPRFSIAQYYHYTSPNIVMNNLNPLQIHILENIWDIFIKKTINELEPKLLECFHKIRNNYKCWTIFEDKFGIFQKVENTKIYYHLPETLKDFCFYKKNFCSEKGTPRNEYLVLKGEPGPNFKNLRWIGDNVFIWDSENIKENVTFYGKVFVGPNCIIGINSVISNKTILYSNVEIGPNTYIGYKNYLGNGCKIGIDNRNNKVKRNEKVVRTSNNRIEKIDPTKSSYATILIGSSYLAFNIDLPRGYIYYGGYNYNLIQQSE